jgi:lipopolysaccharide assembly outer membrane protein LptD (OstA)
VRLSGVVIASSALALAWVLTVTPAAQAQYQPPSEKLLIETRSAATWTEPAADVIQLEGPVVIETDRARLTAKEAVIWLVPQPDAPPNTQRAEIILLGDAEVQHEGSVRSGPRLAVTAEVAAGGIEITAERRVAQDRSDTDLYRRALELRQVTFPAPATRPAGRLTGPRAAAAPRPGAVTVAEPQAEPAPAPAKVEPIRVQFGELNMDHSVDGKVVVLLTGGVTLFQRRENGDYIEFQANTAVLFTTLEDMRDAQQPNRFRDFRDAVASAYFEGDVRMAMTPGKPGLGEQRVRANRIYYDFASDRAVLTDAVVHTVEPDMGVPVVIRAKLVRQLSQGEFVARNVQLSTSTFALPSYSIGAGKVYVRREDAAEGVASGGRVTFNADDVRFGLFGAPLFWLPSAGGSMGDKAIPLRSAGFINSSRYGYGPRTRWGLLESLGQAPRKDFDASYQLDYFSKRGPAGGIDAAYRGGFVTDTTKQRWAFEGDLESYFVYDHGIDSFGRLDTPVVAVHPVPGVTEYEVDRPGSDFRGQVLWRHQHYFPYGWQLQARAGYVSDPTFLEEWFRRQFFNGEERDASFYLKHQDQTEAFTFLVDAQPNDLVTTAEMIQEQFEVERIPEFAYHRIGDSVFNDAGTLVSDNSASALTFNHTSASLRDQGFPESGDPGPGIPSVGYTGIDSNPTYRFDTRQEVSFPFSAGQFRFLPYVVGRYTAYSDSPGGGGVNRVFGGLGARATTSFWKVDNTVESRLFDLHRMRHVIEPEVNVFTSATNQDRGGVFVYDEAVDGIMDLSALSVALRQRWQTERGAPGRRRSVDFFTLNVTGDFFANEPQHGPEDAAHLAPRDFRGIYFASMPEASVARESINIDASWRISDTTILLGDASFNLDHSEWATASAGLIVRRDENVTYLLSQRYIKDLNSNIAGLVALYEMSRKYSVLFQQSYDFGQSENVSSTVQIRRKFDTFYVAFTATYNLIDNESGFSVNIYPAWFGYGIDAGQLRDVFGSQQR